MSDEKISQLEIAVHLFGCINSHGTRDGVDVIETRYSPYYAEEHEKLMLQMYRKRVEEIGKNPTGYLLLVAGTLISRGYAHDNVKEVLHHVFDCLGERYMLSDNSVSEQELASIKDRVTEETVIKAWGEKTSGCVWSELLRVCDALQIPGDLGSRKEFLDPECGVDVRSCDGNYRELRGYPRPWEMLASEQHQGRIREFNKILEHNFNHHRSLSGYELPLSE